MTDDGSDHDHDEEGDEDEEDEWPVWIDYQVDMPCSSCGLMFRRLTDAESYCEKCWEEEAASDPRDVKVPLMLVALSHQSLGVQ